ncbi:MAG: hypothetical protein MJA84_01350, partial [Firmicutes bacterium]|nr:hypothetical protein [Bacillota bacterium]
YVIDAASRKGSAVSQARIAYFFLDAGGELLASGDILHNHRGAGWEQIPARTVTAPAGTARVLVKLLVNGGSGAHDFDNVSMRQL